MTKKVNLIDISHEVTEIEENMKAIEERQQEAHDGPNKGRRREDKIKSQRKFRLPPKMVVVSVLVVSFFVAWYIVGPQSIYDVVGGFGYQLQEKICGSLVFLLLILAGFVAYGAWLQGMMGPK